MQIRRLARADSGHKSAHFFDPALAELDLIEQILNLAQRTPEERGGQRRLAGATCGEDARVFLALAEEVQAQGNPWLEFDIDLAALSRKLLLEMSSLREVLTRLFRLRLLVILTPIGGDYKGRLKVRQEAYEILARHLLREGTWSDSLAICSTNLNEVTIIDFNYNFIPEADWPWTHAHTLTIATIEKAISEIEKTRRICRLVRDGWG